MSTIHRMGAPVKVDEKDDGFATFSLRIPRVLANQIDARCGVSKRSRNKEVQLMLERQIETEVQKDRELIEKMSKLNLAPQTNRT